MYKLILLGYSLALPTLVFMMFAIFKSAPFWLKVLFQGTAFVSLVVYVLLLLNHFHFITL